MANLIDLVGFAFTVTMCYKVFVLNGCSLVLLARATSSISYV